MSIDLLSIAKQNARHIEHTAEEWRAPAIQIKPKKPNGRDTDFQASGRAISEAGVFLPGTSADVKHPLVPPIFAKIDFVENKCRQT